jgi:hypothetical protein
MYSNHRNIKDYDKITNSNEVVLLVLNKYGGGGMIPLILNINSRWNSVSSFPLGSLYPAEKLTLSTEKDVLYSDEVRWSQNILLGLMRVGLRLYIYIYCV